MDASTLPTNNADWAQHVTAAISRQRERLQEFLAAQQERLQGAEVALATHVQELAGQIAAREAETAAQRRAIARELKARRAAQREAREQLAQTATKSTVATGDAADLDDLRRRYEMSLEDLRDLKARNAELQQQLAAAKSAGPAAAPQKGGALNWEAEKQRILAALESDSDGGKPTKEERLKVEDVLHRTDQLLADKDREIEELKKVLDHQSDNLGSVAVGAAALGEMFDKDAIVQEERESLRRLQEEWREKLRRAEIDISMERAKIARERAQVEERLRLLESQAATAAGDKPNETDKEGTPVRGRWLARLGLKDGNDGGGKK
jgi:hypothetical protein